MKLKYKLSLIIAGLLLFSACSSPKKTIKLGFVGGLTGSGSDLGVDGMYGALLAVKTINAAGGVMGRDIELVIKNDQSDPEVALSVDQELVDLGVRFIIGHMISGVATKTVPFVNEHNVLMISPTIAKDSLSTIDDHFIRVIPSNVTQATLLSETIIKQNPGRLGILYSNNNLLFAETFIQILTDNIANQETKIGGSFAFDVNTKPDYKKLVEDLKTLKINSLLIIASGDEVANFAQNFALMAFHPTVFLPAWAMTNDLIVKGGKAIDGYFGVNYTQTNSTAPEYIQFKTSFIKEHGAEPTFAAIMAYESVMLTVNAIISSQSTDPMIIKKKITENNDYHGVFGDLLIDRTGDASRAIRLFEIVDGQFVMVKP